MATHVVIEAILVVIAMVLGAGAGIMVIVLHDTRPAGRVPRRCRPSPPARQAAQLAVGVPVAPRPQRTSRLRRRSHHVIAHTAAAYPFLPVLGGCAPEPAQPDLSADWFTFGQESLPLSR